MNLEAVRRRIREAQLTARTGRVSRVLPTYLEADGPAAPVGSLCRVETEARGGRARGHALAEVASLAPGAVKLVLLDDGAVVGPGAQVEACPGRDVTPVGEAFAGRAVDALGRPIDDGGPIAADLSSAIAQGVGALQRITPKRRVETGVRAIDGLLTLGEGQRIGVFAASGVGKTSLMGQLARNVEAERCVICLVGERGREVEALWRRELPDEVRARTVLVAATSDQRAGLRARAVEQALALAEHWRAEGRHVLLLLDSVTRYAMALREIGLAAGEPPTVRAYTPSVFAALPRVVERCGAIGDGGAITAIMTVLSESDDVDDPLAETMRALLDGHIVLSRSLAEQGRFPAIDVPRSLSRLAPGLMSRAQTDAARTAVSALSAYEASRTLIETGVYAPGADPEIDAALARRPALLAFLRQDRSERVSFEESERALVAAVGGGA